MFASCPKRGGMSETSQILFLRPDLVAPGYREAQPQTGTNWQELVDRGVADEWPGYFGAPTLATASRGARILRSKAADLSSLAVQILDGFDYQALNSRARCRGGKRITGRTSSRSGSCCMKWRRVGVRSVVRIRRR